MPGHLNRETRRLRLSRGGGAWESPSVRLSSNFSFSVFRVLFAAPPRMESRLQRFCLDRHNLDIRPKVSPRQRLDRRQGSLYAERIVRDALHL